MPAFEDEASLFSLASEYLEAAEILARAPPIKINVSLVTFYLVGHAAELLLKSLLHKHGVPLKDLKDWKRYGHDLSKLIRQVQDLSLVDSNALPNINEFSKTYSPKHTEYRQIKVTEFPSLDSLLQEVRALQSQVFNHVWQFTSGA